MPLKLVRRPRAARRMHPVVLKEVEAAYEQLVMDIEQHILDDLVGEWTRKPVFKNRVSVRKKKWHASVNLDPEAEGSQYFKWADLGTAERGGRGEAYKIKSKKANRLKYVVPYLAKTPPSGPTNQAPAGTYYSKEVTHPGIWPRNFSETLLEQLKDRSRTTTQTPPGFRAVTEAAIKRAFRKLGIYK